MVLANERAVSMPECQLPNHLSDAILAIEIEKWRTATCEDEQYRFAIAF
jgi:hypothetical protein